MSSEHSTTERVVSEPVIPDLVITGVTVLTHVDGSIEFVPDRTITVTDGAIVSITETSAAPVSAIEIIDARGQVAMPGFINCHTHSPMTMFRGAAEDIAPARWFNDFIWPMEVNLTDDDVELATRLAVAEMISAGVTTFADHYFRSDIIGRVVEETGIRANLGETFFSGGIDADSDGFAKSLEFATTWRGRANGRITTSLAPHAPYTVTDADLERVASAAITHDLLVHIHASEGREQTLNSRDRRGITPIEVLRRTGILEAKTLIAHGIGIVEDDFVTLQAASSRVGVGSAPKGYLKNGIDTTPVRMLRAAGVAVGLATDGAASNNTLDVWESMTFFALMQKATEGDNTFLTAADVLDHATLQSARAVQLQGQIGSLAVGHRADILLVDLSAPRVQPVHDLASTLVYSGRSDDVTSTIVDGVVLMRDRELLTIDVPAVVAELAPRLPRLTDRTHGTRINDYEA